MGFSVSPRPLGFGILGFGAKGLGPGFDNIFIERKKIQNSSLKKITKIHRYVCITKEHFAMVIRVIGIRSFF